MILVVDNYDSFVHNLARYVRRLGQSTHVVRNDDPSLETWDFPSPAKAIIISPGPCSPSEAGKSLELVQRYHQRLPILGICLGHQAIVQAFGGEIIRSPQPMHGRSSPIFHDAKMEFERIPNPCLVARYHSLVASPNSMPDRLCVSATTQDGIIMGVRHRRLPVWGWQFHPESIMTEFGFELLRRFLDLASLPASRVPKYSSERRIAEQKETDQPWPARPITF